MRTVRATHRPEPRAECERASAAIVTADRCMQPEGMRGSPINGHLNSVEVRLHPRLASW